MSDAQPITDQKVLREVKRMHSIRFATALQIASLRQQHNLQSSPPEYVIEELDRRSGLEGSREPGRRSRHPINVNGSNVAALADVDSRNDLRRVLDWELSENFNLDRGVPYATADAQPSVLLAERRPVMRTDPEKPTRAAAFSGWIMAQPSSAQDIEQLIERAQFITRRRMYERT